MSMTKPFAQTKYSKKRALLIPAAGRGVRFKELSKYYPKCTLPVGGVPIIRKILEPFMGSGQFDVVVIGVASNKDADRIAECIATIPGSEAVEYVNVTEYMQENNIDPKYEGPATTIAAMIDSTAIKDYRVTIFLSDMTADISTISQIIYDVCSDVIYGVEKEANDYSRWCMLAYDHGKLSFYDKPTAPVHDRGFKHAAIGVYDLSDSRHFFDSWKIAVNEAFGELQLSDVFRIYREQNPLALVVLNASSFQDYGTLEEYIRNKGINRCRSFNAIGEFDRSIVKRSDDYNKIIAEGIWMKYAPDTIKEFVPEVYEINPLTGSVEMEKVRFNNLRDVALYIDRSYDSWVEIFKKVRLFIERCEEEELEVGDKVAANCKFWDDIYNKTVTRLKNSNLPGRVIDREMEWVTDQFFDTIEFFKSECPGLTWYHGDLHFANMFYCFHYGDLKLIDPRGELAGDIYYDIAKLAHSVYGMYDYIDAELYRIDGSRVKFYNDGSEEITRAFEDVIFNSFEPEVRYHILMLTASLFLSMIPLHKHNEQNIKVYFSMYKKLAAEAAMVSRYTEDSPENDTW